MLKRLAIPVLRAVQDGTLVRVLPGPGGKVRLAIVADRNDKICSLKALILRLYFPLVLDPARRNHLLAESETELEFAGVRLQVFNDLKAGWETGVVLRKMKEGKLGEGLGGVQMEPVIVPVPG